MKNVELIFENCSKQSNRNYNIRSFFKGSQFVPLYIRHTEDQLNGFALRDIISEFNALKKHHKKPIKFVLDLGDVIFTDKITYIMLDTIIYHIFQVSNFRVSFLGNISRSPYYNSGVGSTAFLRSNNNGLIDKSKFIEAYEKFSHSKDLHYRFFISREKFESDPEVISFIQNDAATFLSMKLDSDSVDAISEIISELVSNVKSHNNGDCIVDIDFVGVEGINGQPVENHIGCKVAILNFSENCLGDRIKEKLLEKNYDPKDTAFLKIEKAHEFHKDKFNDEYSEDDFYNICTFQKHITSRNTQLGNAGTGLTNLIEHLIEKCVDNYSYMLSGDRIIYFREDYLGVSESGEVGFNTYNNFESDIPNSNILTSSRLEVPGTLYHLSFIFDEGEL